MEWLKKLGKAIDYIEDNLDKEISYDEAARIACCSPYYFQRVFSYVSGVSLAEYIRRRKMTQAAFELQRADSRVIAVLFDTFNEMGECILTALFFTLTYILLWCYSTVFFKCCDKVIIVVKTDIITGFSQAVPICKQLFCQCDSF